MKEQIHIFPNARMAQIAAVAGGNTFIDWSNGSIKFGTKQNVLEIPETIALAFCIPNLWVNTNNQEYFYFRRLKLLPSRYGVYPIIKQKVCE